MFKEHEIIDELNRLAERYNISCAVLYEEYRNKVMSWQYGRGGKGGIHRGWYCPSPIRDLVIGGINRGKLLKRMPQRGKPADHEYGFDAGGQLIIVDGPYSDLHSGPYYREVILDDGMRTVGLRIGVGLHGAYDELCGISLCTYKNDKIKEYIAAFFHNARANKIESFDREQYQYGENGELLAATWERFNIHPPVPLLRKVTYHFFYDSEGRMSHYTAQADDGIVREYPV